MSVLIVEDDADIREMVEFHLGTLGLPVVAVAEGESARQCLRDTTFDLIMLDVSLPGVTGIQLLKEIRSTASTAATPVILMTARARPCDIEVGLAAGADQYVVKPFRPIELGELVRSMLARG